MSGLEYSVFGGQFSVLGIQYVVFLYACAPLRENERMKDEG